jgi:cardiolipin synthase
VTTDLVISLVLGALAFAVSVASAGHALLYKRDPRAALGWIATCVFFPFFGAALYFGFGINRIRTRAQRLGAPLAEFRTPLDVPPIEIPGVPTHLLQLERVGRSLTRGALVAGNRVTLLHDGEQAYPAMLAAIEGAQHEVLLSTYIFATDETGVRFAEALARANDRGVRVRVLVDGIGALYSFPTAAALFRRMRVPARVFLPPRLFPPALRLNLRNHRKILAVDGVVAFTGGMNIGDRHLAARTQNPRRVVDLHVAVEGAVVASLRHTFAEDWQWVTGEPLESPPPRDLAGRDAIRGSALCRVVADGPGEELEKLEMLYMAAIALASRRIRIMTPYFLPPRSLISALQAAALRGVEVTVVLPAKNNLPYVHWATQKMLWEFLSRGVRVLLQPPPFVHTKLFAVDDDYLLLGSPNLDARSLRLNFELALEVYDRDLGSEVSEHFDRVVGRSREVSLAEMEARPLLVKVRDALAWLASPYL